MEDRRKRGLGFKGKGVLGILKLGFCEGNEEHMKVLLILD